MQYKKTLAALDLIKFLEMNPSESIQLPTMEPRKAKLENPYDEQWRIEGGKFFVEITERLSTNVAVQLSASN
jgi:hypothetical protein